MALELKIITAGNHLPEGGPTCYGQIRDEKGRSRPCNQKIMIGEVAVWTGGNAGGRGRPKWFHVEHYLDGRGHRIFTSRDVRKVLRTNGHATSVEGI